MASKRRARQERFGLGTVALVAMVCGVVPPACSGSTTEGSRKQGVTPDGPCSTAGAQEKASDGCNTCTCSGGAWRCTEMACVDGGPGPGGASSGGSPGAGGGPAGGRTGVGGIAPAAGGAIGGGPATCVNGTTMFDGCNSCTCMNGQWACTKRACPPPAIDAGSAPRACGARAGDTCTATEYCAYQPGQYCGQADAQSVCTPRPQACTEEYAPVCGCDMVTYPNGCFASAAGTGVFSIGPCASI